MNFIKRHLSNNNGDENVSKMTLVAIVFVVGAILLLLITTAFKEPIQNWYNNTIDEWFNEENGQYSYDKLSMYDKNDNGTYKGLDYVLYLDDGRYVVICNPGSLSNTSEQTNVAAVVYTPEGKPEYNPIIFVDEIKISNDGRSITMDDQVYHAQLP